jgi:hypothetical protein
MLEQTVIQLLSSGAMEQLISSDQVRIESEAKINAIRKFLNLPAHQ